MSWISKRGTAFEDFLRNSTSKFDFYELGANPMLDTAEHDDEMELCEPREGACESIHAVLRRIGKTVYSYQSSDAGGGAWWSRPM